MRREEQEHDMLEQLLRESLASEAVPSDDFTARLMEKVNRTPQEKRVIAFPYKKVLATVAACAVIAVAIPLVLSGGFGASMNDTASADCAAPMDSNGSGGADLTENAITYADQDAEDDMEGFTEDKWNSDSSETPKSRESDHALTLTGQDAQNAAAILETMDITPESTEEDRATYLLTAGQAQALADTMDVLYAVEDDVVLVLIWEDGE